LRPRGALALVGAASWLEDVAFLRRIRGAVAGPLFVTGDALLEDTTARLAEIGVVDGALLDFASPALASFLRGARGSTSADGRRVVDEVGALVLSGRAPGPHEHAARLGEGATVSIPTPRHDLFARLPYRYAFVRRLPMATTLTEVGCPYACTFCVTATLSFRLRPVAEVVAELRSIRAAGIREVFVFDQTFGIPRERAVELLARWIREAPGLSWFTFARADRVDPALLRSMRRAGCHTLIFGVETGDEALRAETRKALDADAIRRGFRLAREAGLRVAATFVLGLPGETRETIERTTRLALELDPDYASFNVAVPRARTALRREALAGGWIDRGAIVMDQSGSQGGLATGTLSPEEVLEERRRLVRRFYFRPGYLLRAPLRAGSLTGLRVEAREGAAILGRWLAADRRAPRPRSASAVPESAP